MNARGDAGSPLEWTESLGFHIKRAEQAIAARKAEIFRNLGLTVPQAMALCLLLDAPPKSCTHLSRESYVTSQTMTGIIGKLEAAQLVLRHPSADHARVHLFELTEKGHELATQARILGMGLEEELLDAVAPDARAPLLATLSRLADLAPEAGTMSEPAARRS
ncbi:hypothetical protein GCM10023350_19940 [Nocardioides endophyticus]|uniref:HTH marR-type domain-containing protein n=1 Tax=Nocardioides endophyticus TaxID=1353775 RepID=A0ABP8YT53_9ACTN